jgi:hypothetical protein
VGDLATSSPAMNFMKIAYGELAAEYDGLHEPEKAKQFLPELAEAIANK